MKSADSPNLVDNRNPARDPLRPPAPDYAGIRGLTRSRTLRASPSPTNRGEAPSVRYAERSPYGPLGNALSEDQLVRAHGLDLDR
jgi:hypothetical protein